MNWTRMVENWKQATGVLAMHNGDGDEIDVIARWHEQLNGRTLGYAGMDPDAMQRRRDAWERTATQDWYIKGR